MATLTQDQLKQISIDIDEICEMLTNEQVLALAQKVSPKINLSIINKEKELIVLYKIIHWVDRELYQLLPNEYYTMVHNTTDGISEADAELLKRRLIPLINDAIDIPFLSEKMEAFLITLIVGLITHAMVKGFQLEEIKTA